MTSYLYCDQTIVSKFAIPELPRVDDENWDVSFSIAGAGKQSHESLWNRYWRSPGGEKVIFYHKNNHFHWLRFPGLADFSISVNSKEIACYPVSELPAETIRHLLLDQVLPRCLAHRGRIMLHASTVCLKQGALVFIGGSGAGKSTLAGEFHRAGNPVVSDDCVWITEKQDTIVGVPSYGGLRLWEDSLMSLFGAHQGTQHMAHYSTKKRISLNAHDIGKYQNGSEVLAIVVLSPPGQVSEATVRLASLPLREAFIEAANESFQLDSFDIRERDQHMQTLGLIVKKVPVFRLFMPRDYEVLPLVRQKILETVL